MKLLAMEIRLTGERGDFATAEKTAQALYGLARHLGNSEAPSSLDFVVAAGMRAQSGAMLQEHIAEAKTPDELEYWRALLPDDPPPAADDMLRGDWDEAAAAIYLPAILGDPEQVFPKNIELTHTPEATGEAFANLIAAGVREAESRTPQEFMDLREVPFAPPPYQASADVSEKSRKLIEETLKWQMQIYQSALLQQRSQTLRRAAAAIALARSRHPIP